MILSERLRTGLLISLLFALVFSMHLYFDPHDTDLWLHLAAGRIIDEQGSLPATDVLTFTRQGQPWSMHEWLYQIFVYKLFLFSGLQGLLVFKALIIVFVLLLLFMLLPQQFYLRMVVVLLFSIILLKFSNIRPHVVSWLFFLLLLYLLQRERYWLLPFLFVLWGNIHPLHLVGLVVACFFLAEKFWQVRRRILLILILLSIFAGVLNPLGITIFTLPFTITSSLINEWKPFSPQGLFFYLYTAFVLLGSYIYFSSRKYRAAEIFLIVLFIVLGYVSRRHVALTFLFLTPFFVSAFVHKFSSRPFFSSLFVQRTVWKDMFFLIVLGAFLVLSFQFLVDLRFPAETLPEKEVQILKLYRINGNVFNDYGYGSYLEFWLYPQNLMYIDSRAETMGELLIEEYYGLGTTHKDLFFSVLDKHNVTVVIIRNEMGLTNLLLNNPSWKPIYLDAVRASFVRKISATEQIPAFDVLGSGLVGVRK